MRTIISPPVLSFRPESGGVVVDLERLIGSRLLIQANSGGGKSWMLRYVLEQTQGRIQQIILDPEGEFASLREAFDYVLAGREGDVPADPRSAKLLARRLIELGVSAVVDLYDLRLPDRRRFVRLFLEELMHLPRSLWRPLLVAVDEAHNFCPERGQGEAESTAELLNKLIGRTGLDVDMKRAGDELGMEKESRLTLRDLAPGQFYAFGPALARGVTLVRSGPVRTTHPRPGVVAPPAPPAPEKVRKVLTQLQDLPKQAEEEARDLAAVQRKVRELEAELRRAQRPPRRQTTRRSTAPSRPRRRSCAASAWRPLSPRPLALRSPFLRSPIARSRCAWRSLHRSGRAMHGAQRAAARPSTARTVRKLRSGTRWRPSSPNSPA